ncbi:MAG: hypothetical protein LBQ35_04260, partial [Spirochaetaceae bacterium]|nr:hypothetical protein [Spirochaetaceae bacterium]
MSDSTQSRNPGRITTPEEYWEQLMEDKRERKEAEAHLRALFAETDRQMKESIKETDRRIQETDRLLQETLLGMKETDKRMKETDRLVGRLGNRFGELAEHLVVPNLKEKFNALGYRFDYTSTNVEVAVEGRLVAEIDVLLENGEYALAVEIKSKPVLK